MDFKALSRTAEADVPAFASAALRRLVQTRFFSVEQTRNLRRQRRAQNPTPHSGARESDTVRRLKVGPIVYSPRFAGDAMPRRASVIPRFAVEATSSLLSRCGDHMRAAERWIESIRSDHRALRKTTPRTARSSRRSQEVKPRPPIPIRNAPPPRLEQRAASTADPNSCHPPCRW